MTTRIHAHQIEGLDTSVPSRTLVPVTTAVAGTPDFVWTDDDDLVMVEVIL